MMVFCNSTLNWKGLWSQPSSAMASSITHQMEHNMFGPYGVWAYFGCRCFCSSLIYLTLYDFVL